MLEALLRATPGALTPERLLEQARDENADPFTAASPKPPHPAQLGAGSRAGLPAASPGPQPRDWRTPGSYRYAAGGRAAGCHRAELDGSMATDGHADALLRRPSQEPSLCPRSLYGLVSTS